METRLFKIIFLFVFIAFCTGSTLLGQTPVPKTLSGKSIPPVVDTGRRLASYKNLLKGQRYMWLLKNSRSIEQRRSLAKLAEEAFLQAAKSNPADAEIYSALAELTLLRPEGLIVDVVRNAELAIGLDPDNFNGHRFLALIYTSKSNIGKGRVDLNFAKEAIRQWIEVARLDKRYAEAWAFLSAFYEDTGEKEKEIEALENWVGSLAPIDSNFYKITLGGDLAPEGALLDLGAAYLEVGRSADALRTFTRAISSFELNDELVDLMELAVEELRPSELGNAVATLQQISYSNPENADLTTLLAETVARTGKYDDAVELLEIAISKDASIEKVDASRFQTVIGNIFADSNRTDKALAAYLKALELRGIRSVGTLVEDEDKDFAIDVIGRMVRTLRRANRIAEADKILDDIRPILGNIGVE